MKTAHQQKSGKSHFSTYQQSHQRHSIALYGPLNIKNLKYFKKEQRENFEKCFLAPCPNHVKINDFDIVTLLSEGGFGKVYLVKNKKTEIIYAMKVMKKKYIVENGYIPFALNEKRILQSLNFPFCIRLQFMIQDKANLYWLLPFISGGDMFTHLKKFKRFKEDLTNFYVGQVILALEFLHYCNLVYRDLKPENILIDHTGYIKVTDFGFTKEVKTRLYTFCGTPDYLAPEIILGLGYSKAVDYWSLGVLIYEMVKGKTPFYSENKLDTFNKITSVQYKMPKFCSKNLQDLIYNLLQADMSQRYGNLKNGIYDIKHHTWFVKMNWLKLLNRRIVPPYIPQELDDITAHFPHAKTVIKNVSSTTSDIQNQDYDEYFIEF